MSGSSGRLVISGPRGRAGAAERTWSGQVFDYPETAYELAMREFVWRSAPRLPLRRSTRAARTPRQETAAQAAHRTLRQQQRQQEDARWEAVCRERQARLRPAHWSPRQYAL